MTSLTGSTAQTLKGTIDPPPYAAAIAGALVQIGTLGFVWSRTSASACLTDPLGCFSELTTADPWGRQALITLVGAMAIWLFSLLPMLQGSPHSDPSIVDRLWSVQPVLYCWHFYLSQPNPRLLVMSVLVTIWGSRLTYNFIAKGGYSGGEDYRWKEIRTWYPGWRYEVFNLVFICAFQQLEILAFSVPAVAALQAPTPLNSLDAGAAGLCALLVLGEAVSDRQMFVFQTEKYRRINAGLPLGEYSRGFIETGLWSCSRHPNYFCEVSFWWMFYLFSVAATGELLNWTILGTVFLTCMFVVPQGSLDVTEALSSRKYASYPEYQQRVSRFFPWFPRKGAAKTE